MWNAVTQHNQIKTAVVMLAKFECLGEAFR
jgi:hypothetical protein